MTRIVAGIAKGRTLRVPPQGTRPTSARVREALFSKLEHWDMVVGMRVLDLFAGSGALGLEALSRGAAAAVFVDQATGAMQVVKANAADLGLARKCRFITKDAAQFARSGEDQFDLIFVDPPYAFSEDALGMLLESLGTRLAADGLIVVERDARSPEPLLPSTLSLEDSRVWGDTAAWFVGTPPVSA